MKQMLGWLAALVLIIGAFYYYLNASPDSGGLGGLTAALTGGAQDSGERSSAASRAGQIDAAAFKNVFQADAGRDDAAVSASADDEAHSLDNIDFSFLYFGIYDRTRLEIHRDDAGNMRNVRWVGPHHSHGDRADVKPLDDESLVDIHKALLKHAREDRGVPSHAYQRLASRTWAFHTAMELSKKKPFEEITSPPTPAGWKDLAHLLLQTENGEAAILALDRAGEAVPKIESLYLRIVALQLLGKDTAEPARELLRLLEDRPQDAQLLIRNANNVPAVRFVRGGKDARIDPNSDKLKEIVRLIREASRAYEDLRLGPEELKNAKSSDTFQLLTDRAAPGQELYALLTVPDDARGRAMGVIVQGKHRIDLDDNNALSLMSVQLRADGKEEDEENPDEKAPRISREFVAFTLPDELQPGSAEIQADNKRFPITVMSTPAPPQIVYMESRRVVPGEWVRLVMRGMQSRKWDWSPDQTAPDEKKWEVRVEVEQEKSRFPVHIADLPPTYFGTRFLLVRIPDGLTPGPASIRVRLGSATSADYPFQIADYPVPVPRESRLRNNPGLGRIVPTERFRLIFQNVADAFLAVVKRPDGEYEVWTETEMTDTETVTPSGIWQVPATWPNGVAPAVWAERRGGHWVLADMKSEKMQVGPKATKPQIESASFYSGSEGSVQRYDRKANRYVKIDFKPGELTITSPDIWEKQEYAVRVTFESGNDLSTKARAAYDRMIVIPLGSSASKPLKISMAKYINGVEGDYSDRPVEINTGFFQAETPLGRRGVEWVRELYAVTVKEGRNILGEKELLTRLNIDTFPVSPWGGRWHYVPTPNHPSYTLLAFDIEGTLKAQFYSWGANMGFIEYDLLSNDASIGSITGGNALWTAPYESSGMGHLVADAMRAEAKSDIGIWNVLGLRGNLPRGQITKAMIADAMPFDNNVVSVMQLSGEDLRALIIEILPPGRFLYISGARVTVRDPNDAKSVDFVTQGSAPLIDTKLYTVAISNYVARSMGYQAFTRAAKIEDTKIKCSDAVVRYIRAHSPVKMDYSVRVRVESSE